MLSPLNPSEVVVGLLTENTAKLIEQATRLVRSIRWFGGRLTESRIVVCTVGRLEAEAERTLLGLGAELRIVTRFHPANPTANRHQLIAELLDAPEKVMLLLDCDTIVVQDPLPFLDAVNFQAKIAPTPTVSDGVFERLFPRFGIPKPERTFVTGLDGTPTIPYFNGGVLAIPREIARTLAPPWRSYNQICADDPELVAPCQRHMHQASLSLALAETNVPVRELPLAMNFQINATHVKAPSDWATTDPVIIHYHHLATDDGLLMDCPYPAVQARIEEFNERVRAEGLIRAHSPVKRDAPSRSVLVLGMHRSGTSLIAQLLHTFGIYAGAPNELTPGDIFNPTGFWELVSAVALDDEVLAALGAKVFDCAAVDTNRIPAIHLRDLRSRAGLAIESLQGHGPFLLKDPRISLLVPFWREVLSDPVCVIVWRHPMAVARSLATRDRFSTLRSLALWEHYNRTLLRDTAALPRVLVSYDELLADPERVASTLHARLVELGVEGLSVPERDAIDLVVKADFDRSGRGVDASESMLDTEQRALLADLRSGAAVRGTVAPTGPRSLQLIADFGRLEAESIQMQQQFVGLHRQLEAVHGQYAELHAQFSALHAQNGDLHAQNSDLHAQNTELHARNGEIHSQHGELHARFDAARRALEDRDRLLRSVFESRSWKLGHRLTGIVRRLTRSDAVSAAEQWERMKRESTD